MPKPLGSESVDACHMDCGALTRSIRSREINLAFGRLAADDALAFAARLTVDGDAARGGLGILLDLGLAFLAFAPPRESPAVLDDLGQLGVVLGVVDVGVAEGGGARQQGGLDGGQHLADGGGQVFLWDESL